LRPSIPLIKAYNMAAPNGQPLVGDVKESNPPMQQERTVLAMEVDGSDHKWGNVDRKHGDLWSELYLKFASHDRGNLMQIVWYALSLYFFAFRKRIQSK